MRYKSSLLAYREEPRHLSNMEVLRQILDVFFPIVAIPLAMIIGLGLGLLGAGLIAGLVFLLILLLLLPYWGLIFS